MKSKTVLLSFVLLLLSCSKNEDVPNIELNVLKFEIGQKFKYVLLKGENYSVPNNSDFVYTGDTLELEVLDIINNKYLISEKITPFSNMMVSNEEYYWGSKDAVYRNNWTVKNDSLNFDYSGNNNTSHLLLSTSLFNEDALPLKEFDEREVEITGWKTSFRYAEGDFNLYARNFTLFEKYYDRLNIYLNNSPMASDGAGRTIIYGKKYGIIRTSTYSWWTDTGIGWDRIN